ncbi:MAG: hypothetical protein ACOC80_02555 [Petrotogales bacterium]
MTSHSRILWLHERIIRGHFPSLKDFSDHFNISRRQASREISYLRNKLKAPLRFSMANKGYYYSSEFSIPSLFARIETNENIERTLIQKVNPILYNALKESLEVKIDEQDKKLVPFYVDLRKETALCYFPEKNETDGVLLERFNSLVLTGRRFSFVYAFDFEKYRSGLLNKTLRCVRVKVDNTTKILLYSNETELLDWLLKNASKKPMLNDKKIKEKLRRKLKLLEELLD